MKKNNTSPKKTESLLHIQELAHSRKKSTKFILKFFVWILILSFVTTLGVTWGGASTNYGNIVSTKKTKIDLSPTSFFMRERDSIHRYAADSNPDTDPRLLNKYVNETAFAFTEAIALRNDFIEDIHISPSPATRARLRRDTGAASSQMMGYYYGLQSLGIQNMYSELGILPILGEPTISDIYAFNDVSLLQTAAEGLVFSLTNFLGTKISLEEKQKYYIENAENWADRIVAESYTTDSRSNAFELAKVLTNQGYEAVTNMFSSNKERWSKTIFSPQNIYQPLGDAYDLFLAGILAFRLKASNAGTGVSSPTYKNGKYVLLNVSSIGSYDSLDPSLQQAMTEEMVQNNYKTLEKQYKKEWLTVLETLKKSMENSSDYSTIAKDIPGVRIDVSELFSPLTPVAVNVMGTEFLVPIMKETQLLAAALNTPEGKSSPLMASINNKNTYYALKPLMRSVPNSNDLTNIQKMMTSKNMQSIFGYKNIMLDQGLTLGLRDRYQLKSDKALLTNFKLNVSTYDTP